MSIPILMTGHPNQSSNGVYTVSVSYEKERIFDQNFLEGLAHDMAVKRGDSVGVALFGSSGLDHIEWRPWFLMNAFTIPSDLMVVGDVFYGKYEGLWTILLSLKSGIFRVNPTPFVIWNDNIRWHFTTIAEYGKDYKEILKDLE